MNKNHHLSDSLQTIRSPKTTQLHDARAADLHNLFDQRLVGADLGALQPADVLADPGDQGELGPFAHGVPHGDPHEGKQAGVI